jgi:hypothetical protein
MGLFVLTGLTLMFIIIGLVIPSSVKISRGIIIDVDSSTVYQHLTNVKEWGSWIPWVTTQEGAIVQTSQTINAPGAFFTWRGLNDKNSGTITLLTLSPSLITTKYELKGMNDSEGGFRLRSIPNNLSQTEVQWFMEYKLKWYPWERFYGIFMDHIIGPSFEKGLQELRNYIDKEAQKNG